MAPKHFIKFKTSVKDSKLPNKFTFPFYYQPHLLAKIATEELQKYLENQTDFKHNFGISSKDDALAIGKMFGVLVVKDTNNEIGYLAAFSGKLNDNSFPKMFVPPVFNMRTDGSFYLKGEEEINQINKQLNTLNNDAAYIAVKEEYNNLNTIIKNDLIAEKERLKQKKRDRKQRKKDGLTTLNISEFKELEKQLVQESFNDQFYLKELQEYYDDKILVIKNKLSFFKDKIDTLEKQRKEKSNYLQQTLFKNYSFLNKKKETKHLLDIFNNPDIKPPAGSGECAAPKLLQYAFLNNLTPICMAEFWWGVSPSSAIRQHKNFYPACQSRCKPILEHMLKGIEMDDNLLLENLAEKQELKIVYEDDVLIVVNKPSEFLSVPGKEIKDSVYTRIKKKYPEATGPLIVHRLDMSTSGILLLTKTKEANKVLQSQFINRTVKKRYVALLNGILTKKEGIIQLPLRVDLDDRPKQLVDFIHGKNAKTKWETVAIKNGKTRVNFYPITGRTHQLRVHAAHKDGLNTPIIGDDLYGTKTNRLHLHAAEITFTHPSTNKETTFKIDPDF